MRASSRRMTTCSNTCSTRAHHTCVPHLRWYVYNKPFHSPLPAAAEAVREAGCMSCAGACEVCVATICTPPLAMYCGCVVSSFTDYMAHAQCMRAGACNRGGCVQAQAALKIITTDILMRITGALTMITGALRIIITDTRKRRTCALWHTYIHTASAAPRPAAPKQSRACMRIRMHTPHCAPGAASCQQPRAAAERRATARRCHECLRPAPLAPALQRRLQQRATRTGSGHRPRKRWRPQQLGENLASQGRQRRLC